MCYTWALTGAITSSSMVASNHLGAMNGIVSHATQSLIPKLEACGRRRSGSMRPVGMACRNRHRCLAEGTPRVRSRKYRVRSTYGNYLACLLRYVLCIHVQACRAHLNRLSGSSRATLPRLQGSKAPTSPTYIVGT